MAQTTEQMLATLCQFEMAARIEGVIYKRYSGYEVIYDVKPLIAKKRKKAKHSG